MMGSPEDYPERIGNEVLHQVTLTKGFYMQTTQVTQKQWMAVMGDNPSKFKESGENAPVEPVSWNDVQEFIKKLNEKEEINVDRLPTEAEWEYACRSGGSDAYCFGSDTDKLDDYAWYIRNAESKTHPGGEKLPNALGLYDMHGNVREWRQDWFGDYPKSSVKDPVGPETGGSRVFRDGGWDYYLGFRLSRSLP